MDASPQIRGGRHEAERLSATQYALVLQFDYLASWLGRKYARRVPKWVAVPEDLIQAGREGLCRAAIRFKPGRAKFVTFATAYVRGEILHYLRDLRPAPRAAGHLFLVPLEEVEGRPEGRVYAEFERAEAMAMLQVDLQVLPERYRRILVLQGLGIPQRVLAKRERLSQRSISRMFTAAAKVVRDGGKGAEKLGRAPGRPRPTPAVHISSPEEWLAKMNVLYPSDPIVLSRKSRGGRERARKGESLIWEG